MTVGTTSQRIWILAAAGSVLLAVWAANGLLRGEAPKADLDSRPLAAELAAGSDVDVFLASSAATRLNAYASGFADETAVHEAAREVGWEAEDLLSRLERTAPAID